MSNLMFRSTVLESGANQEWPESTWWMVIRIGSHGMTKGDAMPTMHWPTLEDAKAEAKRLAAKFPNHPRGFAVVEVKFIFRGIVDTFEMTFDKPIVRTKGKKGGSK